MVRVRAGISYALAEAMDEGHCGLPIDELVLLTEKLLEVPEGLVRTALDLELAEGTVIAGKPLQLLASIALPQHQHSAPPLCTTTCTTTCTSKRTTQE